MKGPTRRGVSLQPFSPLGMYINNGSPSMEYNNTSHFHSPSLFTLTRYHARDSPLGAKQETEARRPLAPWVRMDPALLRFFATDDGFLILPLHGRHH
jgi:hypothetical protein